MTDKSDLLALLREGKSYISGQELSDRFGVSRTAVWKAVKSLRDDGYEIEAVSNKGYRLISSPDVMSESEMASRLRTVYVARELHYYDRVDSTNVVLRRMAEEAPEGTLAVADMQEAGRGRRGRGWISPPGINIYMSLLLKPEMDPSDAPMITLLMALAVADAVIDVTGLDARIKWPNDVVTGGRKICGILTEMDMESDYIRDVIVGVGINVNQTDESAFPEEIRNTATSLRMSGGSAVCRSELVAAVMNLFEGYYEEFRHSGDLRGIKDEYEKLLVSMGLEVRVLDPKGEYSGTSRGINDRGELLVELSDGTLREVYAGEVSVRGIYGYA